MGVVAPKLVPHRLPPGSISRPRLLQLLETGRDRGLTLVSAPAGFGKTTLLTEWVGTGASTGTRFAWVNLDSNDAEPVRFWRHVIASLARVEPAVGDRSMAALTAQPEGIVASVLPVVFQELATATGPTVLILDDLHRAENPSIDEQLEEFLRYRPSRVQLVVATRSDPAIGVARLRASGELVEVRADALAFDAPELSAFFTALGVRGLSDKDERRLAEQTGGWPAPLRLAALLMPQHDRASFIDTFAGGNRQVVDYLTRDVLDLLPAETRAFLLRVSVLRRMNGALCDAVLGASGSGEVLAELERANLFVSADVEGRWYQQHQLFAGALRLELNRTTPDEVPTLHLRAAAWFESVGDLEEATEHAIAARDVKTASRLVAAQIQALTAAGRGAAVRRWLAALDWPEAAQDPELAFVRAVEASLANQVDEAVAQLKVARSGSGEGTDVRGLSLGFRADFLEGIVAVTQVGRAEAAARRAVTSAPDLAWEGVALAGLGQAQYLQGHLDDAIVTLRRAAGQIPDANPVLLGVAIGSLGLAESARGDQTSRADAMLDGALRALAAIASDRTSVGAVLHLASGERERRAGDVRSALARFDQAIDILGDSPRGTWLAQAYLLRASAGVLLGDLSAATADIDLVDEILDRVPDPGDLRDRSARVRRVLDTPVRLPSEFGETLSDRELDVLRLAAEGLDQRQIGEQLFISYNTVKSHLKTAYRKLGVSSRAEAVERLRAVDRERT